MATTYYCRHQPLVGEERSQIEVQREIRIHPSIHPITGSQVEETDIEKQKQLGRTRSLDFFFLGKNTRVMLSGSRSPTDDVCLDKQKKLFVHFFLFFDDLP